MNIEKRQTDRKEHWDLYLGNEAVGEVWAEYKTRTQRFWSGRITVNTTEGIRTVTAINRTSAKKVIDKLTEKLDGVQVITRVTKLAESVKNVSDGTAPAMSDLVEVAKKGIPKTTSHL